LKKAYFNWSSGKDAALALYRITKDKRFLVSKLVTTINTDFDRVSMHGLRVALLKKQAEAINIPLQLIAFEGNVSMQTYTAMVNRTMTELHSKGYHYSIFGDIFLEELKQYRDQQLATCGITGVYPLWKENSKALLLEFLDAGFKAITICTNAKVLDASFCGRIIDADFIADLPEGVDPCGENGEFHTFVYDGPIFNTPVTFKLGEKVLRTYTTSEDADDCFAKDKSWDTEFWYCDLLPVS